MDFLGMAGEEPCIEQDLPVGPFLDTFDSYDIYTSDAYSPTSSDDLLTPYTCDAYPEDGLLDTDLSEWMHDEAVC